MKYDIDLFERTINFIVEHGDEPELYLKLSNGTLIEFTCYKDYIDVWINENYTNTIKFKTIAEFLDNFLINNLSLREVWDEVKNIYNDLNSIDFTKEPEEQFLIINGRILYTPKQ